MKDIEKSADPNYGISRFDDDIRDTHGWRVSLRRHGKNAGGELSGQKMWRPEKGLEIGTAIQ